MTSEPDDYSSLLEFLYVVPVGLIRAGRDGTIRNMNPTANSVLAVLAGGAPPANAFTALKGAVGDLRPALARGDAGLLAENLDFVLPGAAQRTFSLALYAVGDSELAFILSDVTERVRQRRQILRREMELRSIFETVHNHMIVLLDDQLRIQEYNASIQRLTGFGEEVVGKRLISLFAEPVDLDAACSHAENCGWADIAGDMTHVSGQRWWGESVLSRIPDSESNTVGFALVSREATERRERELQLEQQALVDALTGLSNRRVFDDVFSKELKRAQRYDKPLALLLFDIDHFKQVNDRYGHPAGDEILRAVADRLSEQVREVDLLARLGGEEFAVLAPEAGPEAAIALAERCRGVIAGAAFPLEGSEALSITISAGVALRDTQIGTPTQLYEAADSALYRAKTGGRNRVETAR